MSTDSSEGGGSCHNDKLEVPPSEQQGEMDSKHHQVDAEEKECNGDGGGDIFNEDGIYDEKKLLYVKRRRRDSDEKCIIQ